MMRVVKCSHLRIIRLIKPAGIIPLLLLREFTTTEFGRDFRHKRAGKPHTLGFDHCIGSGLELSYCLPLCGLSTRPPFTRECSVNTSFENSKEYSDATVHSGDSKAIFAISRILTSNPWCADTEDSLRDCLSSVNVNIVIKVIKTVPAESALRFFHWLTHKGFPHDFSSYHAMIDALGEAGRFDEMRKLVAELRESVGNVRTILYRDVIYWCACVGNIDEVILYWEDLKKDQIKPSSALWTALIDVYAKAKKYEEAVSFYSDMLDSGVMPNSRTFSIFIDHLVSLGSLDAAASIVEEMQKLEMFPSMHAYACLMAAHAKVGSSEALKRLGRGLRYVCNWPSYAFWNVITAMLHQGLESGALSFGRAVWPELSSEEIVIRASNNTYVKRKLEGSCMTTSMSDKQHGDKFSETDADMETLQGVSHVRIEKFLKTWDASTLSFLRGIKLNWTAELIYELLSRRIQKPHVAWNLFCWLKDEAGVQHDIFNQITMLRILSKHNLFSSLALLLMEMQQKRVRISTLTINFIIADFGLAKNASAALWTFNCLKGFGLEPDQESYMALLDAFSRANFHDEALALLDMLIMAGFTLEASSCTMLIGMLTNMGKADKGHSVFQKFLDAGGNPTTECFTAIIKAHCWSGNTELALQMYTDMTRAGIAPVLDTLWTMAWVHLQNGNLEKVKECLLLPEDSLSPQEKKVVLQRDCLEAVKAILTKSFIQGSSIPLCEAQF